MTMRLDYSEKRDFTRMEVEFMLDFRLPGAEEMQQATGRDLSGGGVRFETPREMEPGTRLEIVISPQQKLTPPLEATAEVVRVEPAGEGCWMVSCRFLEIKG